MYILFQQFCGASVTCLACTDYGHPERAFFKILELLGLGRHFGLKCFEAFGVFSAPILILIYLGVGFDFRSQRICLSVVRDNVQRQKALQEKKKRKGNKENSHSN